MSSNPTTSKWNAFGPGILFAGSAVGTSHIVQSTRAGADYSMVLLLIFILIAIVKYPAIRFGKDYSAITGKTLIHSYAGLDWPILLIYGVIIVISAAFAFYRLGWCSCFRSWTNLCAPQSQGYVWA